MLDTMDFNFIVLYVVLCKMVVYMLSTKQRILPFSKVPDAQNTGNVISDESI